MRVNTTLPLLFCLGIGISYAQIPKFDHIIIVVQENRTPDNLFQGLCSPPYGSQKTCEINPSNSQYNIQQNDWLDNSKPGHVTQPMPVDLANTYDLDHSHKGFSKMCATDNPPSGPCRMGGLNDPKQFHYVNNTTGKNKGILNPYLDLATQYGWANYMFQTNQGPSFPAHQFLFGGTSAPSAADDAAGIFASENICVENGLGQCKGTKGGTGMAAGCDAPAKNKVQLIKAPGVQTIGDVVAPCFEHDTVPDKLGNLTWRYYAPGPSSIWTAPNAIRHIRCDSPTGVCDPGPDWTANVDTVTPSDVLQDIVNCNLRSVSWVIPSGQNSDHAKSNDGGGPSWVASIVNAIGESNGCDANGGYWKNTAIVITWDDWGGWYDHEAPPILAQPQGDYQYGFRVPLLFVSAYTQAGTISNVKPHDFGSILRFVENNFSSDSLHFADERAGIFGPNDLHEFYDLARTPRAFTHVAAKLDAKFFLNDKRTAKDPDDQ